MNTRAIIRIVERHRWYATGILLGFLVLCLLILAARFSILARRVPLPIAAGVTASRAVAVEHDPGDASETPQAAAPSTRANELRLDLNTADMAELTRLPGIGGVLAGRIVEYRESHGPFRHVSELTEVEGIGEGKLAAIEELIYAGPAD